MTTTPWSGQFGIDYTERNPHGVRELDELYLANFGVTRTSLNIRFLGEMDRNIRILEVGCNVGVQLRALEQLNFYNLTGVDVSVYALEKAEAYSPQIRFMVGSIFQLPFPDDSFDLVFTSGVLIHISPRVLPNALMEMHRVTRRWVWGYEYYNVQHINIPYRRCSELLWKGDFCRMYAQQFRDLHTARRYRLPYLDSQNMDEMFLMEKRPNLSEAVHELPLEHQ